MKTFTAFRSPRSRFYKSFGKDTTAATTNGPNSLMVFYGGLYDGTAAVSRTLPSFNEWDIRHALNSIFGFVAMLCAGLVAVEIPGSQAGLLTLISWLSLRAFWGEYEQPKDFPWRPVICWLMFSF